MLCQGRCTLAGGRWKTMEGHHPRLKQKHFLERRRISFTLGENICKSHIPEQKTCSQNVPRNLKTQQGEAKRSNLQMGKRHQQTFISPVRALGWQISIRKDIQHHQPGGDVKERWDNTTHLFDWLKEKKKKKTTLIIPRVLSTQSHGNSHTLLVGIPKVWLPWKTA